jgi:hypothetical protein
MGAFPVTTFNCSQRGAARVASLLDTTGGAVCRVAGNWTPAAAVVAGDLASSPEEPHPASTRLAAARVTRTRSAKGWRLLTIGRSFLR